MNSRQRRKVRREHYSHCKNLIANLVRREARMWRAHMHTYKPPAGWSAGCVIIDDPPDFRDIKLPEPHGIFDQVYERSMIAYKRILGVSDE